MKFSMKVIIDNVIIVIDILMNFINYINYLTKENLLIKIV